MIVAVARAFFDRRRMPTDQQRLHVILGIQLGETIRRLRDIAQISSEVTAGVMVETAGAWVNVDVNCSHDSLAWLGSQLSKNLPWPLFFKEGKMSCRANSPFDKRRIKRDFLNEQNLSSQRPR